MYVSHLSLRNFRQFGDGNDNLELPLSSGVTALVGRNDSGKSAVIDAIRYALLTRDQNYIRVEPEDFHIGDAIGLAYRWHDELLKNRETFTALARRYGVTGPFVHRRLRLIQLSPAVLCKSLNGTLALNTTLEDLTEAAKHLDWDRQAQFLGLDSLARSC